MDESRPGGRPWVVAGDVYVQSHRGVAVLVLLRVSVLQRYQVRCRLQRWKAATGIDTEDVSPETD